LESSIELTNRSGASLVLRENNGQENREVLLSSNTAFSSSTENNIDDEEEKQADRSREERINRQESPKKLRKSAHPLVPEQRFCEICNLIQPYRTKHCHLCERCINKFDHHCVWLGML